MKNYFNVIGSYFINFKTKIQNFFDGSQSYLSVESLQLVTFSQELVSNIYLEIHLPPPRQV